MAGNLRAGLATALVLLAASALALPAMTSAHKKGYDVFFSTIRADDVGGRGHIEGSIFIEVQPHPKEACIPRRPIRLYEVTPGADRLLAGGRTDRFGRYDLTFPGGHQDREFSLKLLRKVIRKDGRHLHYCEAQTATFGF